MAQIEVYATRIGGWWRVQTRHGVGVSRDLGTAMDLAGFWR